MIRSIRMSVVLCGFGWNVARLLTWGSPDGHVKFPRAATRRRPVLMDLWDDAVETQSFTWSNVGFVVILGGLQYLHVLGSNGWILINIYAPSNIS
jgi:hypothetical protein